MDATALVFRRGQLALNAALGLGVVLILAFATLSTTGLVLLPLVLLTSVAAVLVVRRPLLNLFILLFGVALTSGYTAGITLIELLHGTYLLAYLLGWFADRLVTRRPITRDNADRLLLMFLVAVPFTVVVTIILDGSLGEYAQEMFAMMHLALYFPIRDACKSERGNLVVVAAFLLIAVYATVRNGYLYSQNIVEATMGWQVERNRVSDNDGTLMVASLLFATMSGIGTTRLMRSIGVLGGMVTIIGLILTQSRAFWVSFLLGILVILLVLRGGERYRVLKVITAALALMLLAGFLLFRAEFILILFGLAERLATLGSATTNDISLYNRFRESAVVLDLIAENPIVGHGAGVGYLFFEIGRSGTDTDSFVHNGFLGLWYKWGIWGLIAIVYFWLSTIKMGLRGILRRSFSPLRRIAVAGATASLVAYLLAANTSNPFVLNDALFLFAVLFGLIRGNAMSTSDPPGAEG